MSEWIGRMKGSNYRDLTECVKGVNISASLCRVKHVSFNLYNPGLDLEHARHQVLSFQLILLNNISEFLVLC